VKFLFHVKNIFTKTMFSDIFLLENLIFLGILKNSENLLRNYFKKVPIIFQKNYFEIIGTFSVFRKLKLNSFQKNGFSKNFLFFIK